jgi:hypothetical protein
MVDESGGDAKSTLAGHRLLADLPRCIFDAACEPPVEQTEDGIHRRGCLTFYQSGSNLKRAVICLHGGSADIGFLIRSRAGSI